MSASPEYESEAREDYGPTTSSENVYEVVTEEKLTDNMSLSSVKTPVLRARSLTPVPVDPEPDSTNLESVVHSVNKVEKEVEFHISEKRSDEMSVDEMSALSGIVRIEEATIDDMGRIAYPIIQETEDSNDSNYIENSATIIQAPLNTAIVQNVTKLPQNFTINVDGAVGNITAIQNVTQDVSSNQTLWLPTILATSAATTDPKIEEENSPTGVSQIIITSESYVNDVNARRPNIVTDSNYINRPKTSKVQILSNISIPKTTYTPQYVTTGKEITSQVYGTQNHIYKLSTNVISQKQQNNSVLCSKPIKNQSLIGCSALPTGVINNSPIKNVAYSHTFTKNTNLNKTLNKVNNGANLNAMVAASSGNTQCHILSRVVSGPNKMSVHSGRKSVNTFKGPKNSSQASGNAKNQSRAIKIIQQTGSVHKSEAKTWPVASVATYKATPPIYGVIDANASKIIQKVGSPTHKSQQPMTLQKVPKGERLVLQSPCGPVLISTAPISASLTRGPHYVQSGSTPNLRYVQTYGSPEPQLPNMSQVSANQQLTAQILQSLSQPKLMLQPNPAPINQIATIVEEPIEMKPAHQKRIVFGDKTTLLTADDIIGMEERPNLYEELQRYSVQALAFVMLDHTYALPKQKQMSPTPPPAPIPPVIVPIQPPILTSPPPATTPPSPIKRTSPVIMSTATYEMPVTVPTAVVGTAIPVPTIQLPQVPALTYKPPEDDAASVISSLDGDKDLPRGGSDTETAPEGEEEGKTRCICDFTHDDGYMICCDRCGEWQHVDCMGIDRQNIPDAYMCELCHPRPIDRRHARAIQLRKREELSALAGSDSDSTEIGIIPGQGRKRLLTVTTYTNTSGSSVTTYNADVPVLPPAPQPPPAPPMPKRGPKRPKKTEIIRKGAKRKFAEKRVKRKKEILMNRKYNTSMSSQSHWQDSYELAVTNHYSPELRAKMMKYSSRLGNTGNMAVAVTAHLCTTVPHAGGKILIATKDLKDNMPIIELRGKYMLSTQHRPQPLPSSRLHSQKPGPFVFFYRLPKDNTQVCIDTRTYGNEARFVRRSCKPNAELQHCIVKGALHVYLVTICDIQSNTEITVGHDSNGSKQPCACGNPKHCKVNGLNSMGPRKSIEGPPREKRSKTRTFSSSSPMSPPMNAVPLTPVKDLKESPLTYMKMETKAIKQEYTPMSPIKSSAVVALNFDEPIKDEKEEEEEDEVKTEIDLFAKEEMKPELDEPDYAKPEPEPVPVFEPEVEEVKEPIKEEPLPEPVVEKIEPPVIPKQEEPVEPPKIDEPLPSDEEKIEKPIEKIVPKEEPKKEKEVEKPVTRETTAKSACHDRSSRSSRTACTNIDSLDDKTDDSQDKILTNSKERDKEKKKMTREERKMEAIMKAFERMEKAQQRKQEVKERQKRRESEPHPNAPDKDDDEESQCHTKKRRRRKGRARTTSQSNRRRLNSADSDIVTSGDEAPRTPPRIAPITHKPERNISDDIGLSSACLLVEAAVGSVESAFKLPKTKKTMANEWLGRSPERTPSPYRSPYRPPLLSAPSLDSLVRVASTMIGDLSATQDEDTRQDYNHPTSPPRTPGRDRNRPPKKSKRITRNTPPTPEVIEPPPTIIPQHSAKKRWLRQAISEESDAPAVVESPPSEMVTPLKKRRLARESLSCEQNIIVPCNDVTSPLLTSEDSPVKCENQSRIICDNKQNKLRSIMENMYGSRDRTRSDSGQGSDDQCNIDHDVLNVNIKGPHDSEHIRRIIGVPTPEDEQPPEIIKPEDIRTNNNNVELEECNYNKVVPMEIDTTITPQPKIQETNDDVKCLDSPNEKPLSADTSGNSSPQRDEMDDIQKKIHSFHTENILMLKSRNKKPPKEKRKKVNLNFDLSMVDDQISVQLRTEDNSEVNGDMHEDGIHDDPKIHVSPENIPLPPIESIPLPAPETIPLPAEPNPIIAPIIPSPESIPLPEEPMKPTVKPIRPRSPSPIPVPIEKPLERSVSSDRPLVLDNSLPFSTRFSSTGLFSGIFSNINQTFNLESSINENVPNLSIIKSAIDSSSSLFDKDSSAPVDELKCVDEILTRVNNMDSNNSVLLSGVLNCSNSVGETLPSRPAKPYCPRSNDPRLNPPPADKPKPVRRKLSISEYRKRHKGVPSEDSPAPDQSPAPEWSSSSSGAGSMSPQRLDAAAAAAVDDLEMRLHTDLATPILPKGVFDAAPTSSERQREKLSSRLRREFGLALPDDTLCTNDPSASNKRCDR